jgi:hypothetical protein
MVLFGFVPHNAHRIGTLEWWNSGMMGRLGRRGGENWVCFARFAPANWVCLYNWPLARRPAKGVALQVCAQSAMLSPPAATGGRDRRIGFVWHDRLPQRIGFVWHNRLPGSPPGSPELALFVPRPADPSDAHWVCLAHCAQATALLVAPPGASHPAELALFCRGLSNVLFTITPFPPSPCLS